MLWMDLLVASVTPAIKQVTSRLAIVVLVLAMRTAGASEEDPSIAFSHNAENQTPGLRWCTADELLPRQVSNGVPLSPEWSAEVVRPPYGCDCSFYKARYFCPDLDDGGYRAWVPQAVADGVCKSVTRSDLRQAPLPPNFRVSVYGNSYLRQVIEGLMCMFHDKVETKRVRYHDADNQNDDERTVSGDTVCRECRTVCPECGNGEDILLDHGCISEDDVREGGCLCADDTAEFVFENGAIVHYYFASRDKNKSPSDSLLPHRNVSWSWYDAVVANQGNNPPVSPEAVLAVSAELQEVSVPFFWLNTYEGGGEVSRWEKTLRPRFEESGAKHVKIDAMTQGMNNLTKGAVESDEDPHFCLPGPPDEMASLLAKMMWAVYFETGQRQ